MINLDVQIADLNNINTVREISEILNNVTEKFKASKGGHVPDEVVENIIHKYYTSIDSIQNTFSKTGYRFVLVNPDLNEILGTVLISIDTQNIFVVDSCNINVSTKDYKNICPENYHNIFNLAIKSEYQNKGLAAIFINQILDKWGYLFTGKGFWLRSDPPLHNIYKKLGFVHKTKWDKFLPEDAILPFGFNSVLDFNNKFLCDCLRPSQQLDLIKKSRYKYCVFTYDFK